MLIRGEPKLINHKRLEPSEPLVATDKCFWSVDKWLVNDLAASFCSPGPIRHLIGTRARRRYYSDVPPLYFHGYASCHCSMWILWLVVHWTWMRFYYSIRKSSFDGNAFSVQRVGWLVGSRSRESILTPKKSVTLWKRSSCAPCTLFKAPIAVGAGQLPHFLPLPNGYVVFVTKANATSLLRRWWVEIVHGMIDIDSLLETMGSWKRILNVGVPPRCRRLVKHIIFVRSF